METYGILSLLPVAVVIVLVLITRQTTLCLLIGGLVGAVILYGSDFAMNWIDTLYSVMSSSMWIWLVLVCGLFSSLVALFEASGGISSFTALAAKFCKGEKKTLFGTWLMGVVLFVDDWLSILSVAAAMRHAIDRLRIPREMLAFMINGTASCICVIVPTSTWGVYMLSQLVATGVCDNSNSLVTYLSMFPFMFYPIMTLICGVLFAVGVIPVFGPMKKAYSQLRSTELTASEETSGSAEGKKSSILNFVLPVVLITIITLITGEILYGILICMVFCAVLYIPQRLMTIGEYMDTVLDGFKSIVSILFIITAAFMLRDINNMLGMPEYVIGIVNSAISPEMLPAVAFVLITVLGVAAGNFWGICAISFPVVIPLAQAMNSNILLTAAAIISATTAAAQMCFYGAEVTIACSAAEIDNMKYAQTAIPLLAVPFVLSFALFLVAGFVFG